MTAIYESREKAGKAADKLKIYAQPQRLMILSCLLCWGAHRQRNRRCELGIGLQLGY